MACLIAPALLGCGDKVNPAGKCDPELALRTVTYTGTMAGLLVSCTGCHSSTKKGKARSGATEGVDLDSYENAVKWGEESREWVLGGLMPPTLQGNILSPNDPNYTAMSMEDRCAYATWARNGFPK